MFETIIRILAGVDGPLHARDIHARAEEILDQPVVRSCVKDRLSFYSRGDRPQFRRVRHDRYARADASGV